MNVESERLMTVREVAEYLRLGERTVLKLASRGEIPAARVGNQWRFRLRVIDAWLDDQMLGVRGGPTINPDELASFSIDECFAATHVLPDLHGTTPAAVLGEFAKAAHGLELIRDPTWFIGALLERENILSSAVGDGVAFAHTLHRHPEQIHRPFVLVGRSLAGVPFQAPDGAPVHLVVLLGLRYQELHLPWLAHLSALLRDGPLRDALLAAAPAEVFPIIRARIQHFASS